MDHPSVEIIGTSSRRLAGRRIVLGITGSVACVRSPEIARLLMRHGAEVYPVMSRDAALLIGPPLLEWSTGHQPVTEISGATEHVALCGNSNSRADLLLIAPATANTIGKIAAAIDDTPVTTFVTTAVGQGLPVCVVPAMHEPMYRHPGVLNNIETLRSLGITVLAPDLAEGKAKMATPETIIEQVFQLLENSPRVLAGRRVLITAGRTVEYLDPVRVLTNNSSGKMGMALAGACRAAGAEVTVIYGKGTASPPADVEVIHVDTSAEMKTAVDEALASEKWDYLFASAAVGDWRPKTMSAGKITTHGTKSLTVELVPTVKIIDEVRRRSPGIRLIAFRALHGLELEELLTNAYTRMQKADADFIAVNDVSLTGAGFGSDTNEMYLIDRQGRRTHLPMAGKREIAEQIVAAVAAVEGEL